LDEEFELTVGDQLEFILTLKTKWTKQAVVARKVVPAPTPVRVVPEPRARHGIAKFFGSNQRRKPALLSPAPSIVQEVVRSDNWETVVATDGSFARAYIDFSQYEKDIYGRPTTYELACFNEWAKTSSKSKRAPYKIGTLQVQLMFVPRANKKETLPRSIKEALDELKVARNREPVSLKGFLSQLGGDCKYWRRRYFILDGATLTAHSESSRKPRATINLAKAVKVIHDKDTLSEPVVVSGKHRRKSAFAEKEAGAMNVEKGFRIKFGNGEVIDFYADRQEDKGQWITCIEKVISQSQNRAPWADLVLRGLSLTEEKS
jgi:hypothetical protein